MSGGAVKKTPEDGWEQTRRGMLRNLWNGDVVTEKCPRPIDSKSGALGWNRGRRIGTQPPLTYIDESVKKWNELRADRYWRDSLRDSVVS
jgi:hypothetical protein